MPKRFIKRFIPHHDSIREHKNLRLIRPLLNDPNLLHLNRRSVSGAFYVGLFFAWVPVPFQMLLAAIVSIFVRVNLPISMALVWVSNPLTMPPLFYFAYKVGAWIMNEKPVHIQFELSFAWLTESLGAIWQPFLLGCFIAGVFSSVVGGLAVRWLWRFHVVQTWKERKAVRLARKQQAALSQQHVE